MTIEMKQERGIEVSHTRKVLGKRVQIWGIVSAKSRRNNSWGSMWKVVWDERQRKPKTET